MQNLNKRMTQFTYLQPKKIPNAHVQTHTQKHTHTETHTLTNNK